MTFKSPNFVKNHTIFAYNDIISEEEVRVANSWPKIIYNIICQINKYIPCKEIKMLDILNKINFLIFNINYLITKYKKVYPSPYFTHFEFPCRV